MQDTERELLVQQALSVLESEHNAIANAANLCALIFDAVPRLNWTGFYFVEGDSLILGPFQGKLACTRIPVGQGVCGTAVAQRETLSVDNVHDFDGHIACDSASESELVVPLIKDGKVYGVLDIDSPHQNRFDAADQAMFEQLASCWLENSDLM